MRARTRNLLLLAAVAATAWIAWLLLRDGGRPGPREGAEPGRSPGMGTDRTAPPRSSRTPEAAAPAAEAPVPEGPRLDLRAVVAGEWPLPGVQVLAVERFRDGSLVAMIGDDAPDGGETDAEGRITLRYKTEPAERLFGVLPDGAEFESAGNAEAAGEIRPFLVLRASSPGPVTLRFRDPEGTVLVRPVDDVTGEVLAGRAGIRLSFRNHGRGSEPQDGHELLVEKPPGWLKVWDVDPAAIRDVRLVVPGYLPSPAPEGGWKGRMIVRLAADPAVVRGRLAGLEDLEHESFLLSAEDGRPCASSTLAGLPEGSGPFSLSGVPPGKWDLVVRALHRDLPPDHAVWATARFDYRGDGLDLGLLAWRKGGVLRARLVGADGKPESKAPLHLAAAPSGEIPLLSYGLSPKLTDRNPDVLVTWPGQGASMETRRTDPGPDGWAEFGGLRPGGVYVLATGLVPGLMRVVKVPFEPTDPLVVELDGGRATTTCSLRFTVEGEEPRFWRYLGGPAYADAFSTGKGTLEAEIPPGRHLFTGMTTVEEVGAASTFYGEIEIPDSGRFEGTVDLKPQAK